MKYFRDIICYASSKFQNPMCVATCIIRQRVSSSTKEYKIKSVKIQSAKCDEQQKKKTAKNSEKAGNNTQDNEAKRRIGVMNDDQKQIQLVETGR